MKNVFVDKNLPFYSVLYRGGNFIAAWHGISSSRINENIGKIV